MIHPMNKIYIIDISGYIFRAYYAMPQLTRTDGTPVGAVFGFCNMLLKLKEIIRKHAKDSSVLWAGAFDVSRETFRNTIDPSYKANRDAAPQDLIPQFGLIREACNAFDCPVIEKKGFEADDIIATLTKMALDQDINVVIVSSDKDLMQLFRPNVEIFDPMKEIWISEANILDKFGVTPEKITDVQALAGDTSDGITGVFGIGIKTAAELINKFGDLETLLDNIHTITQKKRKEALLKYADNARIAKRLVSLADDVDIIFNSDSLKFHYENSIETENKIISFCEEQNFMGLIKKIKFESEKIKNKKEKQCQISVIKNLADWQAASDVFYLGTEKPQHIYLNLVNAKGAPEAIVLCILKDNRKNLILLSPNESFSVSDISYIITSLMTNHKIIAYDMKAILRYFGLNFLGNFDDLSLMSYSLDFSLLQDDLDYQEFLTSGNEKFECNDETKKALNEALTFPESYEQLNVMLEKNPQIKSLYNSIDKPAISTIYKMEQNGVFILAEKLSELQTYFDDKISLLSKEIYSIAGKEFNIASSQQLGKVLFDDLKLKTDGYKLTKNHTDSASLEQLKEENPIIVLILEWKKLFKLRTTYTETLIDSINEKTQRVHSTFLLTKTNTGRLSSKNPNLQNIPIRSSEGGKIREVFVGQNDNILCSFDYSQIELRLLAYIANVKDLIRAFENDLDIHKITASKIFKIDVGSVDNILRAKAKTVNFGIIYGQSAYALSKQLKTDISEAKNLIDGYFDTYPEIKNYISECKDFAQQHGYVETLFKRRCYVPNINDKIYQKRQFALRQAVNARIQGSSADLIKIAMNKINGMLFEGTKPPKMILQIHDELVFEGSAESLNDYSPKIKDIMENVLLNKFKIKLEVNFKQGKSLASCKN